MVTGHPIIAADRGWSIIIETKSIAGWRSAMVPPPRRPAFPKAPGPLAGANALRAAEMTPAERLGEIAEILAAGLTRLRARQSSALCANCGEGFLDCPAQQSGHANVLRDGGSE